MKIKKKCKNTDKNRIFSFFPSVHLHNPCLLKEAMTMAKLGHRHKASKAAGTFSLAALRRKKSSKIEFFAVWWIFDPWLDLRSPYPEERSLV